MSGQEVLVNQISGPKPTLRRTPACGQAVSTFSVHGYLDIVLYRLKSELRGSSYSAVDRATMNCLRRYDDEAKIKNIPIPPNCRNLRVLYNGKMRAMTPSERVAVPVILMDKRPMWLYLAVVDPPITKVSGLVRHLGQDNDYRLINGFMTSF